MKSERAKKFIDDDAVVMNNGDRMVDASTAYTAIEIAEQEAEERMREKAMASFKSQCVFKDQRCKPKCKGCSRLKHFVQKLNR